VVRRWITHGVGEARLSAVARPARGRYIQETSNPEISMLKEFKAFALRGNVLDLAVGIIIGGAFGTIVKSLVDDVIMPPIGLALGNVDFSNLFALLKAGPKAPPPYASLAEAQAAGAVTVNYGQFINNVVAFIIIAFAVFLVVRAANRLMPLEAAAAPTTKDCPYCRMAIPIGATRCPHCTTELRAA
jgi:large conductance mechanosensitive channel